MEGEANSHPGKRKEIVEDSNPEEEHSPSPTIRTQMVLPVKEGTKREDVITFILNVDEIAQGACWTDKEWVLTVTDLLGGHAAPTPPEECAERPGEIISAELLTVEVPSIGCAHYMLAVTDVSTRYHWTTPPLRLKSDATDKLHHIILSMPETHCPHSMH